MRSGWKKRKIERSGKKDFLIATDFVKVQKLI